MDKMTLYVDMKPELEWVEHDHNREDGTLLSADDYAIKEEPFMDDMYNLYRNGIFFNYCKSIADAKQAAQADYERRTAERFKRVGVPEECVWEGMKYYDGWNDCRDKLMQNIAKAKEQG